MILHANSINWRMVQQRSLNLQIICGPVIFKLFPGGTGGFVYDQLIILKNSV